VRSLPLATYNIAGIDVHKKMLAVVIANAKDSELQFECRITTPAWMSFQS
jgi:hypothetical protein